MEYKRLTMKADNENTFDNIVNCVVCPNKTEKYKCSKDRFNCFKAVINRLAELEDKIENGTLRQFPCNIGDEVFWAWDLDKQYSQVMRGVVIGLSISHKNTVWFSVKYDNGLSFDHTIEDWGKTVFLTKAEAEAKLKELQNER